MFRDGGSDHGPLAVALLVLEVGIYLWAAGLVLLGIRVVRGVSWPRALAAYALAAVLFVGISLILTLL